MISIHIVEKTTYEPTSILTGEILGEFHTLAEAKEALRLDWEKYGVVFYDGHFKPTNDPYSAIAFKCTNRQAFDMLHWEDFGCTKEDKEVFENYLQDEELKDGIFLWIDESYGWAFVDKHTFAQACTLYQDNDFRFSCLFLQSGIDYDKWGHNDNPLDLTK